MAREHADGNAEQSPAVPVDAEIQVATRAHEADQQLKKALSFQDLFMLVIGGIIGSGWLFAALAAAADAGPAAIISRIIGGVLVMFIALCYAEVAGMLPRTGALVRYPHITHGSFAGFLLGWSFFLAGVTTPTIEAEAVISYASQYVPGLTFVDKASGIALLTTTGLVLATALMVIFFVVNYFGAAALGRVNTVIIWWKFIIPVLTFLFLMVVFNASNFTVGTHDFVGQGGQAIFGAIATAGILFAFQGYQSALIFGGEAKNPQRDVPLATILATLSALVLYVLLQIGFIGALNWHAAGVHVGEWSSLKGSAWAAAPFGSELRNSGVALLAAFAVLLNIDAWISPGGTLLSAIGVDARIIYGMAIDGYFPAAFRHISRFGVPIWGLVFTLIAGCIFLLPLPSWYLLIAYISAAGALTMITGGVTLGVLRRTASGLRRPFRLPAANIIAPLGFIAASLFLYWTGTAILNYVVAGVLVGLPLYGWFYAPAHLGIRRDVIMIAGALFLAAFAVTAYFGPLSRAGSTFTHAGGLSFGLYTMLLVVEMVAYWGVIWALAQVKRRRELVAGLWVLAYLVVTYAISYLGAFGPRPKAQQIAFPLDTLIYAAACIAIYYAAVWSGYRTPDIAALVDREQSHSGQAQVSASGADATDHPQHGRQ